MKKGIFASFTVLLAAMITAVALCVKALNAPQAVAAAESVMKIVLDAGHGGIDGGVTGRKTKTKESDINLSITHTLSELLTDMGFEVTLTRKTEAGLYDTATKGFKKRDMRRRKEIIEETKPALVLSIHQNFYPSSTARGGQVFYNKSREESQTLALCLQDKLNALYAEERVRARTASAGEYYMLECTIYPSVIVECGFLSNEKDEMLLLSKAWQRKIAQSIAGGVLAYFENTGVSA